MTQIGGALSATDFRLLFESVLSLYLVLTPDFTIVAVSDAYLQASMTTREVILGRDIFAVFPDDAADPTATGVRNLRASLERVRHERVSDGDVMAVQKYPVRRPASAGGGFEERYWSPINVPVLGPEQEVRCIIHRVEDVTEFVRLTQREGEQRHLTEALHSRVGQMEAEVLQRAQEVLEVNRQLRAANAVLSRTQMELEHRVQERTAMLAQVNAALQQEIAVRQHIEADLRESEARLQAILDNTHTAIYAKDLAGRYLLNNHQHQVLTGLSGAQIKGKTDAEIFLPEKAERYQQNDYVVLTGGTPVEFEEEMMLDDGLHTFVSDKFLLRSAAGSPYAVCGISLDITERKRAEETLRRAKEVAEAADRTKSEFLATMSHELRTPLNVILGYTDLLIDGALGDLPAQQIDVMRRIERNSRVLFELISMVLDLNRLEAGRPPVDVKQVQVAELLDEVKAEMQGLCDLSELACGWRAAPGLPPLHTDPRKLKVVLKNLVSNAVKFTEEGSITVAAEEWQGGIEFSVRDTGIGIPADAQAYIFEPFRQVDGSTTRSYGGSGLGLHIVKRLLEVLGGRITVDSVVGQGSAFRVWMPVAHTPCG